MTSRPTGSTAFIIENAALRAEIERLRALLHEARQYVSDAGNDEDGETQTLSAALLAEIDAALKDNRTCGSRTSD